MAAPHSNAILHDRFVNSIVRETKTELARILARHPSTTNKARENRLKQEWDAELERHQDKLITLREAFLGQHPAVREGIHILRHHRARNNYK